MTLKLYSIVNEITYLTIIYLFINILNAFIEVLNQNNILIKALCIVLFLLYISDMFTNVYNVKLSRNHRAY